jgi:two-component system, cell cycle sensor histidine kinase and response regulator CckA
MDFENGQPSVAEGGLTGPYDSIFDGLVLADAETRTYSDCNLSFSRMLEYRKEEIIGKSIFIFHPAASQVSVERAFEDLVARRIEVAKDIPVLTKTGRIRYFEIAANRVLFHGRPHLFAVFHDTTDRLSSENELRREEGLLRGIFDSTPAGLCLLSERSFVKVNRTLCSIFGYSEEELLGKSTRMLYPDAGEFDRVGRELYGRLASERQVSLESRLTGKDGGSIDALLCASPIDTENPGAGIALAVLDISDRKRAEATLRESESRLSEIQQLVQLGNWSWDVKTGDVEWSPEVYRIFGLDPGAFTPNIDSILALSPPEERSRGQELIRRAVESRGKGSYEQHFLRPDGSTGCYASSFQGKYGADGELMTLVGTVLDISVQKKSEEALRASEEKYRALVDNMQDAVFRCDQAGTILYASPSAARMLGCVTADSMVGLGLPRDFGLSGDDGRGVIEALGDTGKLTRYEARLRTRDDGRPVDVLMDCQFFRDRAGGVIGFECVCADVTERRRMEADRAKLEQMYLQSQRMESIGRLAGGIAHDFNNLLTAIIGNTDMAMDLLEREGKPRALLAQALKAADGAANLTKQLLAFSRKQVVELRTLDLNDAVEGIKKMVTSLLGENVEFVFTPSYSLHPVRADQGQLEQVIMNLAVNARDAMPAGGRLSISTKNASLFESDCRGLDGLKPGDYATMVVSDTGSGMTEEIMNHLFEPFFTTKAKGSGTGLGLATVYGIVKQFGGGVNVESEVGRGTTFTFYLPASPDEIAGQREAIARGESPRGSETILLVEDNAQVLEFGRDALMGLGYTVMTAFTGEEGAAIAGAYDGPIDLLVTDIILPGINGRQTAQRISKDRPAMKTIYTSGYTAEVIDTQGILEEGLNFLPKPFNARELAIKARSVLDEA